MPDVLPQALSSALLRVYGGDKDAELWNQLPLERLKGVLLTIPEFELRRKTVKQLLLKGFKGRIGTICYHSEEQKVLKELGAQYIIHPFYEAGCQLVKQITSNSLNKDSTPPEDLSP